MASFEQTGKKKLWSVRFRIIENGDVVIFQILQISGVGFFFGFEAAEALVYFLAVFNDAKTDRP